MRRLAVLALVAALAPAGAADAAVAKAPVAKKPSCGAGRQAVKHRKTVVRTKRVRTRSGRRKVVRVKVRRTTWRCVERPRAAVPAPPPATGGLPVLPGPGGAVAVQPPGLPGLAPVPPPAPGPTPAPAPDDDGPGGAMTVVARDPDAQVLPSWALTPSRTSVPRGPVQVDFVNWGGDPHNLWLRRAATGPREWVGLTDGDRGDGPGLARATLRLTQGSYTVFCAIGGHEAAGMRTTLVVQ